MLQHMKLKNYAHGTLETNVSRLCYHVVKVITEIVKKRHRYYNCNICNQTCKIDIS